VQGAIGFAALAGILVGWQQLQSDRDQARQDRQQAREQLAVTQDQLRLARQAQDNERFTRAVEQLSSDRLELRLGGIYGLERLAKSASDDSNRLTAFDILSTYVRQHAPRTGKPVVSAKSTDSGLTPPEMPPLAPDVVAAMVVLGRRTTLPDDPPLDLHSEALPGIQLDGADLAKANLVEANLYAAQLNGANLRNANLANADLGAASLNDVHLEWANLSASNPPDQYGPKSEEGRPEGGASLRGAFLV
jgi:hypothetical protein